MSPDASASLCFTPAALSFGVGLSSDVIDAFAYTLTKAQHVARATGATPTSRAYFDAMVGELCHLGWGALPWQTAPPPAFVHHPGGAPVSPLALALEAIESFVGALFPTIAAGFSDVAWFSHLADAFKDVPPNVATALDRWWDGTQVHAAGQTISISSLAALFGTPFIVGGYFVYDFSGSSWRALVEPTSAIGLTSYPMLLQLDLSVYRGLEAALKAELKNDVDRTIYQTPIDLVAARGPQRGGWTCA